MSSQGSFVCEDFQNCHNRLGEQRDAEIKVIHSGVVSKDKPIEFATAPYDPEKVSFNESTPSSNVYSYSIRGFIKIAN